MVTNKFFEIVFVMCAKVMTRTDIQLTHKNLPLYVENNKEIYTFSEK